MNRIPAALVLMLFPFYVLAASPNDVVHEAAQLLSQELEGRREELLGDKQTLYDIVDSILLPRFDRKLAAQLVLGKHWRTASSAEKGQFIEAYYETLLHRYADGVLEFESDRMKVLPYRGDETRDRTVVKTEVQLDDGTVVSVDYSMIKRPQGWLMYDVVIEGISYVRNFRVELDSEIRKGDLPSVIKRLQSEAGVGGA